MRKFVFKLKHDIANDSELPLAAMELAAIIGADGTPVKNLVDVLVENEWLRESVQARAPSRIHDILLRMPYPGAIQAYQAEPVGSKFSLESIARLTYFRDVFVMFSGQPREVLDMLGLRVGKTTFSPDALLSPTGLRVSPTISLHRLEKDKDRYLLRVIANHCFLECTDHVVRLAQRPKDVDRMYEGMLKHLQDNYARAFAASVQMGYKWIEDFIDDRRPPNAYASHSLFGLRGRFFPRMVRALSNHLIARTGATGVVDPFAGVGTLGIECSLLGIPSRSYELNPFFVQVSTAKYHALQLSGKEVTQLEEVREFIQDLRLLDGLERNGDPRDLFDEGVAPARICLPERLSKAVQQNSVDLVAQLRGKIESVCSPECAPVAMLALAYYANSILKKYSREKTLKCVWAHLSRILYLDRFLKRMYADDILAPPASASFRQGNIKNLAEREMDVVAVITSPPYTTAIDYVGNDMMAYYATGLKAHEAVESEMIGSTRLGRVAQADAQKWGSFVPTVLKTAHRQVHFANVKKAICLSKYFQDMTLAFRQINNSLAKGGIMAMVVCGSQEFGKKEMVRYNVADGVTEIGEKVGLHMGRRIDVVLTKNGDGDIRQESVLLFEKLRGTGRGGISHWQSS
jgi:hypothetical protein